ncbi:hypothetical protein BT69DRAFT_554391 [Atractiella rhizophila]|nr:hypothetical protein BT69DRAFT_554391 [Atractiella rhizophila]
MNSSLGGVEALVFDVFGTLVEWEQSVSSQLREIASSSSEPDSRFVASFVGLTKWEDRQDRLASVHA